MADESPVMLLSRLLTGVGEALPAAEWQRQVADGITAGVIDETVAATLHTLHERLVEASRREGLLRLLYDTSTDLIGILDVEAILKAIVRRTRSLIGTDLAYLSLNDYEAGESFVRVTDGATTEAFRRIRVPLGGGVLGAVATGSSPAQSADYPNDTTKSHFPDSDAAVIGEGVKAIMGVPLWAEGKVIGALMVADRRAHGFAADDIGLMESIGAHAAVALQNARLFTDMTRTLDQLHDAQRQNVDHVRSLEALTSLDQRLMETLAAHEILPSLQRLIAESLDARVWILDPSGTPIGNGDEELEEFRAAVMREAARRSRIERAPVSFTFDSRQYSVMSAVAADQHLADILVADVPALAATAVLERSVLVLSAAMLFDRTLRDAQYRLQRELVDELLSTRTEITDLVRERARRFGVDDEVLVAVRVVGTAPEDRQRAVAVLRGIAQGTRVVATYADAVCVIEPVDADSDDAGSWVVDALRVETISATVGSSERVTGLARLPHAYREARTVHNALIALDRCDEAADMSRLGTAGMLLGGMDRTFALRLLETQLGPLLDYDRKRSTELVQSAWVYLDADGAQAVAAQRLHIHPNTMRQRLDRIDGILGAGWRQGGRALDVHIALQLWRLREHGVTD